MRDLSLTSARRQRRAGPWLVACFSWLVVMPGARAQEVEPPPPPPARAEEVGGGLSNEYMTISVNEEKGISLPEFVKLAQTLTNSSIVYEPGLFDGQPPLRLPESQRLRVVDFMLLFKNVMAARGFTAERIGRSDGRLWQVAVDPRSMVTLTVRDAELRTVLADILDRGGVDYVIGPSVSGPVSMRLTGLPWRAAAERLAAAAGIQLEVDDRGVWLAR